MKATPIEKVERALSDAGVTLRRLPGGDFAVLQMARVRPVELRAAQRYVDTGDGWVGRWLADVEADRLIEGGAA